MYLETLQSCLVLAYLLGYFPISQTKLEICQFTCGFGSVFRKLCK